MIAARPMELRPLAPALVSALVLALAAALAGCGDPVLCPGPALLVIQAPSDTVDLDVDPGAEGIQTDVKVRSTLGEGVAIALAATDATGAEVATGTATTDAAGDAVFAGVTLPAGHVTLAVTAAADCGDAQDARTVDVVGGAAIAVTFLPPAADGAVGTHDGVVGDGELTLPICGTLDTPGATVTLAVDGGPAAPANVEGTGFCLTLTLAEAAPPHTIVALASTPRAHGVGSLTLTVDLHGPDPITDLTLTAVDRQRLRLAWTAPAEAGVTVQAYVVKYATSPITEANFDTIGTEVATAPPSDPGQPETVDVFPARTGTAFWVAVAATDPAGNRAPADVVGPVTPELARTGAITYGDPTDGNLGAGAAIASGKFDDDDLVDLAIGVPGLAIGGIANTGAVAIYFGTPTGIAAAPDLVIEGVAGGGKLGAALTAVRWSHADRDDLVVGAPRADGGDGAVYVFDGGAGFPTGAATAADATLRIGAATTPGWFAGANLGTVLATGRVDDDATDDLVIAAPAGGGARGGVAIVFGGTAAASAIGLSDVDPGAAAGAVVSLIEDPAATTGQLFGLAAHVVGRTGGASDATDDLLVGYADDGAAGDAAYLFRPDGSRPATSGVTQTGFLAGRDVRIEYDSAFTTTAFAAQATTIEDQNGDGVRDLVISAYRAGNVGNTLILDGAVVGTAGVARTSDPGVVLTTITGASGTTRLGAAIAAVAGHDPDLDGDGHEDLMIAALTGGVGRFYVWFGGAIPTGLTTVATAGYAITAPASFAFAAPAGGRGPGGQARWVGDVDGDGLDDVCWAAPNDNGRDGSFELLFH